MKSFLVTFLLTITSMANAGEVIFSGHRTDTNEKLKCVVNKSIEYGNEFISFEIEPTVKEKKYYTYFKNLGFYKFGPFSRGSIRYALSGNKLNITSKNEYKFDQGITAEKKLFSDEFDVYVFSSLKLLEENEINFADSNTILFRINNSKITSLELTQSLQEPIFRGPLKYHRSFCIQD